MAFIGLLAVIAVAVLILLIIGVAPIIVGTILYRKSSHKRLGTALRIIGYIVLIPSIAAAVIVITVMFGKV